MSLQDSLFSEDVEKDIKEFIGRVERKRVLVFPPVNNYRRFIIHNYVQNQFDDLLYTFSIGQGVQRRTVVCYKTDVIRDPKLNGALPRTCGIYKISDTASAMGVEGHRSPLTSSENSRQRQVKSVPSIGIYRPPPARKARCDIQTDSQQDQPASDSSQSSKANRQKRPDRAVYVPRHRRSNETESSSPLSRENSRVKRSTRERRSTTSSPAGTSSISCGENQVVSDFCTSIQSSSSSSREDEVNGSDASTVLGLDRNSHCAFESCIKGNFLEDNLTADDISISNSSDDSIKNNEFKLTNEKLLTNIERDDCVEKYSETADQRRNDNLFEHNSCNKDSRRESNGVSEEVKNSSRTGEPETVQTDTKFNGELEQSQTGLILDSNETELNELETAEVEELEEVQVEIEKGEMMSIEGVEDIIKSVGCEEISSEGESRSRDSRDLIMSTETNVKKEPKDEIPNRDEVVNHKNRRIIRQNLVSDVLLISDEELRQETIVNNESSVISVSPPSLQTKVKKVKKVERPKSKPAPPPLPPSKVNRDECDWDSLFDDNGDCLDPTLIEELTTAVGEVTIEQPRSDYRAFIKAPIEVSNDEFAHVVEIYNFPSDFKTSDLAAVFSPFRNGGFELKWVDDTHCLGVFSSPLIAAEVLASNHSFVKTRPLSEATALSKTKARRSAEFLQPYRARPETCAALARRLVTGALGVRLATARQEREREKIVLREAKEKRRLANKQRKDAWDGVITEK